MEVRSTPASPRTQGQEIARFLIDQGELRSILSNLSHELCRPLVSLRAGFDLFLGESPSHDHRRISAATCSPWSLSATTCCAYAQLSRLRGDRPGLAPDLLSAHSRSAP